MKPTPKKPQPVRPTPKKTMAAKRQTPGPVAYRQAPATTGVRG